MPSFYRIQTCMFDMGSNKNLGVSPATGKLRVCGEKMWSNSCQYKILKGEANEDIDPLSEVGLKLQAAGRHWP